MNWLRHLAASPRRANVSYRDGDDILDLRASLAECQARIDDLTGTVQDQQMRSLATLIALKALLRNCPEAMAIVERYLDERAFEKPPRVPMTEEEAHVFVEQLKGLTGRR